MKLAVGRFLEIEELTPAQVISWQTSRSLRPPVRAFPGQDMSPLLRGMQGGSLLVGADAVAAPTTRVKLFTIENGLFGVGYGLDGAILTAEGRPIRQAGVFCALHTQGALEGSVLEVPEPIDCDEVFVGFDGAWRNYFHWLCFAIPKSFLAAQQLAASVAIALPDYALANGAASYSAEVWRQSLDFSGLSARVTKLAPGLYRARRLHFFWTTPRRPTDILFGAGFTDVFDTMAGRSDSRPGTLEDLYLVRSPEVARRLDPAVEAVLARVLEDRGFETMQLEGRDLAAQIALFANARRVVSAHGAGLANVLFHRGRLKVLELNRDLDGNAAFRPWFYITAALRRHRYAMLDGTMPDFGAVHVEAALDALDE
jgi:hypothetical protein